VIIRDLVILGEYERRDFRSPGIAFEEVQQGELSAVDIRGWEGTAVRVTSGDVQIRDCRALGCAGNGFHFLQCRFQSEGNIARECVQGFVVSANVSESHLTANIAAGNRGNGFQIDQAQKLRVYSNNGNFNDLNGIRVENTKDSDFVANMLANNNQSSDEAVAGIHLTGHTTGCGLFYNNFQDTQTQLTQNLGIIVVVPARRNRIQFNLSRTKLQIDSQRSTVGENFISGSN
jgi:hypothetical protein